MVRLPSSIRLNLMLVVLAGVLPLLAFVLGSGWERRGQEIEHAQQTTMRLAHYLAYQQTAETARLHTILSSLSQNPAVQAIDVAACTSIFKDTLAANPVYANFALLTADGEAVASAIPFARQNLSDRDEFQTALKTGALAVGHYAVGKVSGVPILPFAYPVRDRQGRIHGVLIATLRLQELTALFDQSRLPAGSFIGMADYEGRRLYRYPALAQAEIGQPIIPNVWAEIQSARTSTLFTATSSDGLRRIYAASRVSLDDAAPYLNIFVGIPEKLVIAQADAVTLSYLAWLLGSLFLSLGLAWLVGKYGIHNRLEKIAATAQRIGGGDLSARSGLTETSGSLGVLATSMDKMAQNLEADRAALVRARDAKEFEVQRRATLMDVIGDGIVIIDAQHRVVEANPRFAEMLGYAQAEVIGLHTWEYDAVMSESDIRNQFATPTQVRITFESMHRRKNGTTFPVEVNAHGNMVCGEQLILSVVRDVSERKKAEQALQESEERYRTLFENSQDAIAIQEGVPPRFALVNKAFGTLCGYSFEEIYAMRSEAILNLVHADDREGVRQSLYGRLSGQLESVHYSFRLLKKNGECRWVDVTGQRLGGNDKPMNMSIYRDITEAHETQELLIRAKTQAEAASQSKNDFLANMSHEIRTPLSGIVGMLQLVQLSDMNKEQAEYIQLAIQSSKRLTRLLSDILDIARIEASKLDIANEVFNIKTVAREINELVLPMAKQSGVCCTVVVDHRIPEYVLGDGARLQQVLANLIGNALKFTKQGSVVAELSLLPAPRQNQCRVLFSVSDTGDGISEAVLPSLFAPFTQGSQGYRRDHQGAGLGLSICKRLVELMGGRIALESEEGVGTTVCFSLIFRVPEAPTQAPVQESVTVMPAAPGARLLLAEDEAVTRMSTRLILEKFGHTVLLAENGKRALELVAANDFDVVLMDVQMPLMDGMEATRRIRQGEAGPDKTGVPVIAMTAYAMRGDRENFLAAGMDGYISKPIEMRELQAAVNKVLAERKRI